MEIDTAGKERGIVNFFEDTFWELFQPSFFGVSRCERLDRSGQQRIRRKRVRTYTILRLLSRRGWSVSYDRSGKQKRFFSGLQARFRDRELLRLPLLPRRF